MAIQKCIDGPGVVIMICGVYWLIIHDAPLVISIEYAQLCTHLIKPKRIFGMVLQPASPLFNGNNEF